MRHEGLVLSVAFDPAGKRLVTAWQDKTARIWDLASGAPPIVLTGHNEAVFSAAFSSDGRRVVTGSFDKTLRLWDAESGRELGSSIDLGKQVLAVTFTSDDRYLVTSLLDDSTEARPFRTSIAMWNVQTGKRASEKDFASLQLADYVAVYSQDAGILFSKRHCDATQKSRHHSHRDRQPRRRGRVHGIPRRNRRHVAPASLRAAPADPLRPRGRAGRTTLRPALVV